MITQPTSIAKIETHTFEYHTSNNMSSFLVKFNALNSNPIKADLAKLFYLSVVQYKDKLVADCEFDNFEESGFHVYETYEQAMIPAEKDKKYTYHGIKTVIDKDTKLHYEEEADLPMKKFVTVSVEVKLAFNYLLIKYVDELHQFFVHNDHKFPDQFDEELVKFTKKHCSYPISPLIFGSVEAMHNTDEDAVNAHVTKLSEKIGIYFKAKNDSKPTRKLNRACEAFCLFIDTLGQLTANLLFDKRQSIGLPFIAGLFRTISSITEAYWRNNKVNGVGLSQAAIVDLTSFVLANKPEKSSKGDAESGSENSDGEKKPKKKATPRKSPKTPKGNGRGKGKGKAAEPADDEDNVDVDYAQQAQNTYDIDD